MKPYVLGIDLGGTKVGASVVDDEGKVLSRARAKTRARRESDEVLETIAGVGREAIEAAGIDEGSLQAVGVGSPGPLDPDTGIVIDAVNVNFKNFPLGPRLAEKFGCPVFIDNDVNAGVYGEFKAGAGRGAKDVLGVFIGTGVGGGIIADGKLYHGFSKNAGELGHIVIKAGGPRCGCGVRGCFEAVAARVSITRDIRKAIKRGHKSIITELVDKNVDVLPSGELKEAFDMGDKVVTKVIRRATKYIGIAIGSMVNLLSPEIVILGGGVIEAFGDDMIGRIDRTARKVAFEYAIKDVKIVRAELGDDAGVVGAAMLAREAVAQGRPSLIV